MDGRPQWAVDEGISKEEYHVMSCDEPAQQQSFHVGVCPVKQEVRS